MQKLHKILQERRDTSGVDKTTGKIAQNRQNKLCKKIENLENIENTLEKSNANLLYLMQAVAQSCKNMRRGTKESRPQRMSEEQFMSREEGKNVLILSPLTGRAVPLEEVPDPVFHRRS